MVCDLSADQFGWRGGEIFRLITLGDHTDNCAGTYSNEGMQTRGFSGICQNLKNQGSKAACPDYIWYGNGKLAW